MMTQGQLEKFLSYIQKSGWLIFGSAKINQQAEKEIDVTSPYIKAHLAENIIQAVGAKLYIKEIKNISELIFSDDLPIYPFKKLFIPECEVLFEHKDGKMKENKKTQKIALIGVGLLDIKAINLYDLVFAGDPYYKRRRNNSLIIGYAGNLEKDIYGRDYEKNILEHIHFDIFINEDPSTRFAKAELTQGILPERNAVQSKAYKIFIGSLKGQRILEHFGYKDYININFDGPMVNIDRLNELRDKLKNHHNQKIWDKFGKLCIECGKCTMVCPTCFCFRIDDEVELGKNSIHRTRCWDSCYYQEFSEVSGGQKFLSDTSSRIHFWYYHKFARIPDEFGIQGCVGCLRCHKVCPVGINIKEVLEDVKNS